MTKADDPMWDYPRPWALFHGDSLRGGHPKDPSNPLLGIKDTDGNPIQEDILFSDRAIAEGIVRAVNAHDELVSLLIRAGAILSTTPAGVAVCREIDELLDRLDLVE